MEIYVIDREKKRKVEVDDGWHIEKNGENYGVMFFTLESKADLLKAIKDGIYKAVSNEEPE